MPDNHYINPLLVDLYDLDSGWSVDRDFYLSLASPHRQKILDLGCGTGLLCNAYADMGHDVTGVDPSLAMLQVARRKPLGNKIEWVQSVAQTYDSSRSFDLIIMTGHAFQVLLEDDDIDATFLKMKKHLKPGGKAVFESRNPLCNWQSEWNYDIELNAPAGVVQESRRFLSMENDRMKFELVYKFPDETFVSSSELRFPSMHTITERLTAAELGIDKLLGDYHGAPFEETTSREMIFVVN